MHSHQYTLALMALVPYVCAHGLITSIQGANGVNMPGLSIIDGTPRDCATPGCGAEQDTTVFRGSNPLGKTGGGGDVDAAKNIQIFMTGNAAQAAAASSSSASSGSGIAGILTGGDDDVGDIVTGQSGGIVGGAAQGATGAAITALQGAAGLVGLGKRQGQLLNSAAGILDGGDNDIGDIITGQSGGLIGDAAQAATGAAITVLQGAAGVAGVGKRQDISGLLSSVENDLGGVLGGDLGGVLGGADDAVANVGNIVKRQDIGGLLSSIESDLSGVLGGDVGGLLGGADDAVANVKRQTDGDVSNLLSSVENDLSSIVGGDVSNVVGDIKKRQTDGDISDLLSSVEGDLSSVLGGDVGNVVGDVGDIAKRADAVGTETPQGTKEGMVAATAGKGATSGLPTADDNGIVTVTLHQVNQDGAGPFTASVDPTSGGKDASAFQDAQVLDNVGGLDSLSLVTTTDFPVRIQIDQGTVCSASVGGANNVCIVKMVNNAIAGPFGGSAAFTQSSAQKKRAEQFNRIKRSRVARQA